MNEQSLPPGWQRAGVGLERIYDLGTFQQAVAFVQTLADLAEAFNAEPIIEIRHSQVRLILEDQAEAGTLARRIERAAQAHGANK